MTHDDDFAQWWARVEPHLDAALTETVARIPGHIDRTLRVQMRERSHRGWVEHGGDIVTFPPERFLTEALEEIIDSVIYHAARRAILA